MDTDLSATELASELGTSVPRVVREARKVCADARRPDGRYSFTPAMVEKVGRRLGRQPRNTGFTPEQLRVLAALDSAPFGLKSLRSLARRAHVSPTTASKAVAELKVRHLVREEERMEALGHAQRVRFICANRRSPEWRAIRGKLKDVILPDPPRKPDKVVPRELRHLFWNTHLNQLNVAEHGGYIARRILGQDDLNALGWATSNLSADDWRHAASARGMSKERRDFALNLAAERERDGSR